MPRIPPEEVGKQRAKAKATLEQRLRESRKHEAAEEAERLRERLDQRRVFRKILALPKVGGENFDVHYAHHPTMSEVEAKRQASKILSSAEKAREMLFQRGFPKSAKKTKILFLYGLGKKAQKSFGFEVYETPSGAVLLPATRVICVAAREPMTSDKAYRIVKHELAHLGTNLIAPKARSFEFIPIWFSEGLAGHPPISPYEEKKILSVLSKTPYSLEKLSETWKREILTKNTAYYQSSKLIEFLGGRKQAINALKEFEEGIKEALSNKKPFPSHGNFNYFLAEKLGYKNAEAMHRAFKKHLTKEYNKIKESKPGSNKIKARS